MVIPIALVSVFCRFSKSFLCFRFDAGYIVHLRPCYLHFYTLLFNPLYLCSTSKGVRLIRVLMEQYTILWWWNKSRFKNHAFWRTIRNKTRNKSRFKNHAFWRTRSHLSIMASNVDVLNWFWPRESNALNLLFCLTASLCIARKFG